MAREEGRRTDAWVVGFPREVALAAAGGATLLAAALVIHFSVQGLGPGFAFRLLSAGPAGAQALFGGPWYVGLGMIIHVVAVTAIAAAFVWLARGAGGARALGIALASALAVHLIAVVALLPAFNPWLRDRLLLAASSGLFGPVSLGLGLAAGRRLAHRSRGRHREPQP